MKMNEPGSPTKRKHDSAGLKRSVLTGTPCSNEASAATPGTSVKPAATQGTRARPTETLSVKSKCAPEVIVIECNKGDPFVKCRRCGKQNRQGKAFCTCGQILEGLSRTTRCTPSPLLRHFLSGCCVHGENAHVAINKTVSKLLSCTKSLPSSHERRN